MARHLRALQNRLARQRLAGLQHVDAAAARVIEGKPGLPLNIAITNASKLLPDEFSAIYHPKRAAFLAFRQGRGTLPLWRELADLVNVGAELVALQLASDHAHTFAAAEAALAAVYQRQAAGGSWTLRGPEIEALDVAVLVHRVQLEHCSRGELDRAVETLKARVQALLRGPTPPGLVVCGPSPTTPTQKAAT